MGKFPEPSLEIQPAQLWLAAGSPRSLTQRGTQTDRETGRAPPSAQWVSPLRSGQWGQAHLLASLPFGVPRVPPGTSASQPQPLVGIRQRPQRLPQLRPVAREQSICINWGTHIFISRGSGEEHWLQLLEQRSHALMIVPNSIQLYTSSSEISTLFLWFLRVFMSISSKISQNGYRILEFFDF